MECPFRGPWHLHTYLSIAVAIDNRHEETLEREKEGVSRVGSNSWNPQQKGHKNCVKIHQLASDDFLQRSHELFSPGISHCLCLYYMYLWASLGFSQAKQITEWADRRCTKNQFLLCSSVSTAAQRSHRTHPLLGKIGLHTLTAQSYQHRTLYSKSTKKLFRDCEISTGPKHCAKSNWFSRLGVGM